MIGAVHKKAIVTIVKRKRGFTLLNKIVNKAANLVRLTFEKVYLFSSRGKTLQLTTAKILRLIVLQSPSWPLAQHGWRAWCVCFCARQS